MEIFTSTALIVFSLIVILTGIFLVAFCIDEIKCCDDTVEVGLMVIMLIASCLLIIYGGMLGFVIMEGIL
jgi:hypothetical protein